MKKNFGLSPMLYERFLKVQRLHQNSWGSEERREQHSLENVIDVKLEIPQRLFKVKYKPIHGYDEWYHYDPINMEWW